MLLPYSASLPEPTLPTKKKPGGYQSVGLRCLVHGYIVVSLAGYLARTVPELQQIYFPHEFSALNLSPHDRSLFPGQLRALLTKFQAK
jgi:hypothetical protein